MMGEGVHFRSEPLSSTELESNGTKAREHILTLPPSQQAQGQQQRGPGQEDPAESRAFVYTHRDGLFTGRPSKHHHADHQPRRE